jgi:hypothetical protein
MINHVSIEEARMLALFFLSFLDFLISRNLIIRNFRPCYAEMRRGIILAKARQPSDPQIFENHTTFNDQQELRPGDGRAPLQWRAVEY